MHATGIDTLEFIDADEALKQRLVEKLGVTPGHFHLEDGFTITVMDGDLPVAVISICWRELPPPLKDTLEAFIDIIDVDADYRRRGIARHLIEIVIQRARQRNAYQVRAWSSRNKHGAIPMWRALGFGLCPASEVSGRTGETIEGYYVAQPVQDRA